MQPGIEVRHSRKRIRLFPMPSLANGLLTKTAKLAVPSDTESRPGPAHSA
jgi:hypothetical protein